MRKIALLLSCTLLLLVANNSAQKATPDKETGLFGSVKDGKYTNGFLGLNVTVPADWHRLSTAETEAAKEIGGDGLRTDSKAYNKALDEALTSEVVVLALGKKPFGSIGNSALALGVMKQNHSRVTPRMVAEAAKSLLLGNNNNRLVRDIEVETISGKQFAKFDIELGTYGEKVPLRYYAAIIRGHSLTVSMSYSDAAALQVMEDTLRSIEFAR